VRSTGGPSRLQYRRAGAGKVRTARVRKGSDMIPASPIRAVRPRAPRVLVLLALLALSACRLPWDPDPERDAVLLSGSIDAHEVDLSFQAPGRILRLVADEGRHVAQGDVVAELDPLDIELALARARAQEQSARKALAVLRAGSRAQEIASAQAAVQQAQADSNFANHEVDRTRDLIAKGFESDQALDRARSSADTTAAKLEQARQNLSLLKEGPRHEDIDRAAAELAAAHAEAESAQRQLGYVKLMSPAAGVISVRLAEAGLARPDGVRDLLDRSSPKRQPAVTKQKTAQGSHHHEASEDRSRTERAIRRASATINPFPGGGRRTPYAGRCRADGLINLRPIRSAARHLLPQWWRASHSQSSDGSLVSSCRPVRDLGVVPQSPRSHE